VGTLQQNPAHFLPTITVHASSVPYAATLVYPRRQGSILGHSFLVIEALGIRRSKSLQVGQILTALPLAGTRDTLKKRVILTARGEHFLLSMIETGQNYIREIAAHLTAADLRARIHFLSQVTAALEQVRAEREIKKGKA
jgi:hypothetical protein